MAAEALFHFHAQRRERRFRERIRVLEEYNDTELISRYRFPRDSIRELIELVEPDVGCKVNRGNALSVETKVLVALRYYAKGDFLSEVGDLHGVSRSSASRAITMVTTSLNRRLDTIRFPATLEQLRETKRLFYRIAGIPNVIGAVDGTLIPIMAPSTDEEVYVCRKGYHALNVQAIADATLRFSNVVAKWPGSAHDASIFNESEVNRLLIRDQRGILLGDSGYGLKEHLITPLMTPITDSEVQFNYHHSKTRMVVERAFGLLKNRFRCLHKSGGCLPFTPVKSAAVTVACMKLHNKCIMDNLPAPVMLDDDDDDGATGDIYIGQNKDKNAIQARKDIINLF